MERPIILGNFNLCPRIGCPIIGNDCLECEYVNITDDVYCCLYDELAAGSEIKIVDLIGFLAQLLESGKSRIGIDELSQLFLNADEE